MNAHSLRVIILVGCGLLLGIISALLIGITITRVTPLTLSLAEHIDKDHMAFIDLTRLPLADGAATLARSIISPFESAVITWNGPQGTLVLRKKEKTVFAKSGAAADVLPVSSAPPAMSDVEPLFSIAASDPHTILALFAESLQQQNSQFSEGLKGILRAKLEASTHRTDLATAADDLLSGPTRLLITGNKKDGSTRLTTGELRFVVTGQAKNKQVADQWINDLRSATIPARIRTQEFFKENSRTDVLADTDATRTRTQSGWTIADIGAGSSRFTVATKGDQIILSNDPVLLSMATNHLDHPTASSTNGSRSLQGTVDLPWLINEMGQWLPFLKSDISILTATLFGPDVRRVDWNATDAANSVVVRFTFLGNSVR